MAQQDGPKPVPGVSAGSVEVQGINLQVIADVDREMFPDGLGVTYQRPGALEIIGTMRLESGSAVMYVQPADAEKLRAQRRSMLRVVNAPGTKPKG